MIKKKICLLGSFAVGKTSLTRRFVDGIFADTYLSTIGVKVDKKTVVVDGEEVALIIWDVAGEDEFEKVRQSYLQGMAGYLLVVDGTRKGTLSTALSIHQRVEAESGPLPFLLLINKSDLAEEWEIDNATIGSLTARGYQVMETSAKEKTGVDEAFLALTTNILNGKCDSLQS